MVDIILWAFWCVGLLTFLSLWWALAQLLWHALHTDWHWSDK
jgi:hypothetical protein